MKKVIISVTLPWQPELAPRCTCLTDIVTSQIRAEPVKKWKKVEHKYDEHRDIEKKLDIVDILNDILAKARNLIPGRIVDSWAVANGHFEFSTKTSSCESRLYLISREKRGRLEMLLSLRCL